MCGRDKHQIPRRPRVEVTVCEDARHAKLRHLGNVVPANHLPFVSQNWIDPGIVGSVANRVVVEVGYGFVQVVKHLRLP